MYIDDIRAHFDFQPQSSTTLGGAVPAHTTAPAALGSAVGGRPQLILIGHNIINDMRVLDCHGISLHHHFNLIGVADTQILVQDSSAEHLLEGLSDLVLQYQLYGSVYSKRKRAGKGGLIFQGAHNAGNDAVANLKLLICFIFDSLLDDDDDDDNDDLDENAYMANVIEAQDHHNIKINPNLVMMCFDYEGVGGDTSEFGFAWLRMADLVTIEPGERGKNWLPFLRARHFLVDKYKNHAGSRWTDGDPRGFWKEYGPTIIYDPKEGTKPFDELFASITCSEGTTLGEVVPAHTTAVQSSSAGYIPPHKRVITKYKSQGTTLDGVVLGTTAPSVQSSGAGYIPPHKRVVTEHNSQGTTLGVVVPVPPDDDDDEAAENKYMNMMRLACPDNLTRGKKCRTRADCLGSYFLCKQYSKPPHVCPIDEFIHEDDGVYVIHINANCKSFEHGRPCILGDRCTMGHDFPSLRLSLHRWRKKEAARNFLLNGGQPGPAVQERDSPIRGGREARADAGRGGSAGRGGAAGRGGGAGRGGATDAATRSWAEFRV